MAAYTYTSNNDRSDRSEQIEIMSDAGEHWILVKGLAYDLSPTEYARAIRYVVLNPGGTPVQPNVGMGSSEIEVLSARVLNFLNVSLSVNVRDYGAKLDGVTNDTAALAAALAAVTPSPIINTSATTGVVYVGKGMLLTDPFQLSQRTGVVGIGGMQSCLKMRRTNAQQFEKFISNIQDYSGVNDAQGCLVADIRLYGDKYNVTANGGGFYNGNANPALAGNWHDALVLRNDTPSSSGLGYEYVDGRHIVENVFIEAFRGNGLVISGRSDSTVKSVKVWDCDGFSFNTAVDTYMSDCDSGAAGLDGFLFQGNNNASNCKSWFSGAKLVTSRTINPNSLASQPSIPAPPASSGMTWNGCNISGGLTFSLSNGFGNGFLWLTISGSALAGNNSGGTYVLAAQDNARAGLYIRGGRQTIMFEADSNNNNGTSDGTKTGTPVGSFAGLEVGGSWNKISGTSWDRVANTNQQAAAMKITSTQSSNQVEITFYGAVNDGSNMPPLTSDSTTDNNVVRIRANEANWRNASYLATVNVDPWTNKTHAYALTGPMTVSAPALTGTNTAPGLFLMKGMELRFVLAQDGIGGRTVTFNSVFKTTGSIPTTASSVTIIEFLYDGTFWREISRTTT